MKKEKEEYSIHRGEGFLNRSVRRLRVTASYLNMCAVFLLTCTVTHIAVVALSFSRSFYVYGVSDLPLVSVAIFITVTILALCFDVFRRRGDALYEAVSDGFKSAGSSSSSDSYLDEELMHEARYSLRNFDKASDLPLIPGKFGPAVLVGSNLILLIFVISWASKFTDF